MKEEYKIVHVTESEQVPQWAQEWIERYNTTLTPQILAQDLRTTFCKTSGCASPATAICEDCAKAMCTKHTHCSVSDDTRDIRVCSSCFYGYDYKDERE